MCVDKAVKRIMIVTGEASGDLHGANLIKAATRVSSGHLSFFGVGGQKMAAAGCDILIPGEELAVMGIVRSPRPVARDLALFSSSQEGTERTPATGRAGAD